MTGISEQARAEIRRIAGDAEAYAHIEGLTYTGALQAAVRMGMQAASLTRNAQAEAWSEGHAAGRDYQGDGWNADAHDPEQDNPYRTKDTA